MKILIATFLLGFFTPLVIASALHRNIKNALFARVVRQSEDIAEESPDEPLRHRLECVQMINLGGEYYFQSTGDDAIGDCAMYLQGQPDQLIEIEFKSFDVKCEDAGLVSVVDGWELDGQFFPSDEDRLSFDERYRLFCDNGPLKFVAHQNVAMMHWRIPVATQGFVVNIRFFYNPKPCNVLFGGKTGKYTLTNYGHQNNCSFAVIYPVLVRITGIMIGVDKQIGVASQLQLESRVMTQCEKRGYHDFLEIKSGGMESLDTSYMPSFWKICGAELNPDELDFPLPCGTSALRLVSRGRYFNSVEFQFDELPQQLMDAYGPRMCFS
ncbi:PREDICTED: corticotropin-releasing factor-binding protein-like [Priapulus caudatus]|uniref:Corticotropin-releasing factor-binding protein n=1 Tax=Priapulus caudatus TaxID=37621 RepID=A0ABM1DNP1_PRICU|nr:PREDICTED: corticotropin-releasing factor-binding protein-like [Priapulus caudatus]